MLRIPARFQNAVFASVLAMGLVFPTLPDARDSATGPRDSKSASSTIVPPRQLIVIIAPGSAYKQANLVSDVAGIALLQDPLLVNPWGISMTAASPFWVADNGSSRATLYREDPASDTVTINASLPSITIPGGLSTGTVANGTADFVITSGAASAAASFLFASITGDIVGWNPNVPAAGSTTGVIASSTPGNVYTGLAIANNGAGNFLYAADFANGTIRVFNATFALQAAASFSFVDPTIPTTLGNTYHPHNIQNIGGLLYVTYAKVGVGGLPENGLGNGFVRRFNTNGVRDLTFGINSGVLDAPWGIALAPATFGIFGGALLVGNFSDLGRIHGFNQTTGAFLGTLQDEGGIAIQIDQLWALAFGNGAAAGDTGALYFTAGIAREEHGLFGSLRPTTASTATFIQFSSTDFLVNETTGTISITVVRSGDTAGTSTVNFAPLLESQPGRAGAGDFTLAPGTLTFAPGETSRTFVIGITNDALVEGNETLRLVLSNPTGAGLTAPNTATLTIADNGTGVANVSISKTGPATVFPGATFTYTLTVANAGPDAATNVTTTDVLPAGVTFVSAAPSQGTCSGTTTVTCVLGTLASGGTATIALTVTAPAIPATISNTASVTATPFDPVVANNSSIVSTSVGTGTANVSISKTAPVSVLPGATFTYTLTVSNAGPDAATNVTTTDVLPAGVTFVSAAPSQGTCSGTTTVTCVIATLASGATATIAISVAASTSPATISNTASVTAFQSDPAVANNSSTASVIVAFAIVAPVQVPTLSEWALLLLAAMLAGVGGTQLRRSGNGARP